MVVLKMANKYTAVNNRLFAVALTPRPLLYRESDRTPCQCSKLRKPHPEAVFSLAIMTSCFHLSLTEVTMLQVLLDP
jgi:hypothetical protein